MPLWSNDRSPPRRNPSTYAWIKGMTILRAMELQPHTAIRHTSRLRVCELFSCWSGFRRLDVYE